MQYFNFDAETKILSKSSEMQGYIKISDCYRKVSAVSDAYLNQK
jgi:hypothetical protein